MGETDDLLRDLRAARAELLAAIEGITQAELDRRPPGPVTDDEQRWPAGEVLWHAGAVEDEFRLTIDQALGGRPITATRLRERPAHVTTAALLREWLDQTRRPTEVLLGRMTDADLDREFTRPDGQTRTPRRLLTILVRHDRNHAEQVRALRALPAYQNEQ